MYEHHSDCLSRYGGCCDCGFGELNRIEKYLDGDLIAPAPRGLVPRIAAAIEGRDSTIKEIETERVALRGRVRELEEMVSPLHSIDLVDYIGPVKPCPFCGSVALERDGFEGVHTCTPTDAWRKLENERDQYLNALSDLQIHGTPVVEDWVSVPVCEWEQVFKRIGLSA